MDEPDVISTRRRGLSKTLAIAAVTGATAAALAMSSVAGAQPGPPPPPLPPSPAMPALPPGAGAVPAPPPPADPNAAAPPAGQLPPPPPPPGDPNAAPPPADPNAPSPPPPEPGRVGNAAGGFSYVVPGGWKVSEATNLSYGQALLTRIPPEGVTDPPNDTSVLLGRLDLKLFAGAEAENIKAANRLASDMGEFFMPFPGTRVNQSTTPLNADGMPGAASYYEVKFTDTNKPNGQIWAGVVGNPTAPGTPRGQRSPERWFVVWLGSATNPVDRDAAVALANSIRPWAPPPPPPPPPPPAPGDPNVPPPPADPNAPPARPGVGVPVPVAPENAQGMLPPA